MERISGAFAASKDVVRGTGRLPMSPCEAGATCKALVMSKAVSYGSRQRGFRGDRSMDQNAMANEARDEHMRLTGKLLAAVQLLEMIHIPPQDKLIAALKDEAQRLLNKAMLAAWEHADSAGVGHENT